jgi:hypothetical protein
MQVHCLCLLAPYSPKNRMATGYQLAASNTLIRVFFNTSPMSTKTVK